VELNVGQHVFCQKLTVRFLVGSPLEINNRVPTSQARFPQFRVTEVVNAFASKAATSAVIMGHFRKDWRTIYWPYF